MLQRPTAMRMLATAALPTALDRSDIMNSRIAWRGVGVVYRAVLERLSASQGQRGFESLPLRVNW